MKMRIVGAYNEVFEKEWKEEATFKAEHQLAVIADYLFQYKNELYDKFKREANPVKRDVIMAKIVDIEEILNDHADLFTFLYESATAL